MYQNKDYKQVHLEEGFWGNYTMGIKIFVDIKRDFTNTDKENIAKCADALKRALLQESVKLDPKKQNEAAEERKKLLEVFCEREISVETIPNGYCSDYCCKHRPWFMITAGRHMIKIGWRKRVIEIEWDESLKHFVKERNLFASEDVTKSDTYIHAWGYDKAKEYIDKLLS